MTFHQIIKYIYLFLLPEVIKNFFRKKKSTSCNNTVDILYQGNSRKLEFPWYSMSRAKISRCLEPKTKTNWLQMISNDHFKHINEQLRRP